MGFNFHKRSRLFGWVSTSHKPIKKAIFALLSDRKRLPGSKKKAVSFLFVPFCRQGPTENPPSTVRPRAGGMPATRRDKPPPPLAGAEWRCSRHRLLPSSRRLATAPRLHRSWPPPQPLALSFLSSPTVTATSTHSAPTAGRSAGAGAGAQLPPSNRRNLAPLKPSSLHRKTQDHRFPLMMVLRIASRLPPRKRRRALRTWRISAKSKGSVACMLRWLVLLLCK